MSINRLPPSSKIFRSSLRPFKIMGEVLVILALLFAIFLVYGTIPNRWYRLLAVYSGSMVPTFNAGDLVLITPPIVQVKPGMVLTLSVNGNLVTHRLVGYDLEKGLITKGDANPVEDDWSGAKVTVRGIYRGRIPYLGYLTNIRQGIFRLASTGSWLIDDQKIPLQIQASENQSDQEADLLFILTPTVTAPVVATTTLELGLQAKGRLDEAGGSFSAVGEACLTNTGGAPTSGLSALALLVERRNEQSIFAPLADAALQIETGGELAPGETRCFDFQIPLGGLVQVENRVTARATILNYAGQTPGEPGYPYDTPTPYGPQTEFVFALPPETPRPTETLPPTLTPTPTASPTPTPTEGAALPDEPVLPTASATAPVPTPNPALPTLVPTEEEIIPPTGPAASPTPEPTAIPPQPTAVPPEPTAVPSEPPPDPGSGG